MTDLEVRTDDSAIALNTQDVAALGSMLTSHGLTRMQVQALMGRVQKVATQVTMNTLSETLEDIRAIQESRLWEVVNHIRTLPSMGGYVSRDRVIQIIQMVAMKSPRQ